MTYNTLFKVAPVFLYERSSSLSYLSYIYIPFNIFKELKANNYLHVCADIIQ